MASKSRPFASFFKIRSLKPTNAVSQIVLVRQKGADWSKRFKRYGPFALGTCCYLYAQSGGQIFKYDRERPFSEDRSLDTQGTEANPAAAEWKVLIRCTTARRKMLRQEQWPQADLDKIEATKKFFTDKEKRTKIPNEFLSLVNTRLNMHNFFGAGHPNQVGCNYLEPLEIVHPHVYEAEGIEIGPYYMKWGKEQVESRVATKMDDILAVPGLAYGAMCTAIQKWRSVDGKALQAANATIAKNRSIVKPPSTDQNASASSSNSTVGEQALKTSTSIKPSLDPSTSPVQTSLSPDPSTTPPPLPPPSSSKPTKPASYENHIDALATFFSHQKSILRSAQSPSNISSTGGSKIPGYDATRWMFVLFWQEFQRARSMRQFNAHYPPPGNVIMAMTVRLAGPKKKMVFFAEADFDPSTESWGPLFLEHASSLRQRNRLKDQHATRD